MYLTDADFQRLLTLRSALRRFLHWSEEQARAAGLTPAQHQLLLAIRGHPDRRGPRIAEIADYLALRHHSAVELIDRARDAGLVRREADSENRSAVRVRLTPLGAAKLEALAGTHMRELSQLAPTMRALWAELEREDRRGPPAERGWPAPLGGELAEGAGEGRMGPRRAEVAERPGDAPPPRRAELAEPPEDARSAQPTHLVTDGRGSGGPHG